MLSFGVDNSDRLLDAFIPLRQTGGTRPVASLRQLIDRGLTDVIELANRQEQIGVEAAVVDLGEHERRLTEATELLAKRVAIQCAIRGGSQLRCTAGLDFVLAGAEQHLEVRADGPEHADVQADLLGPSAG